MTAAVIATDLVLSYGSTTAVAKSSFVIPAGSLTAVVGPNGSGKSTLLSGLAGLIEPESGSIEIENGYRVSYVLQATKVNEALPVTVREVVRMGRYSSHGILQRLDNHDHATIEGAMADLGITDLGSRHMSELSGGQRQRVFLAQGIAQDHEILLLDEPLTGLDLVSAQAIDGVIHDATSNGCTVVITTHDLTSAAAADHVLLLCNGVIAVGAPDAVLTPAHLRLAYGASLMHLGADDTVFVDDPAHASVPGRHLHRDRTIHIEASESDLHGA